MTRALVTGGAGFVGSNLVRALVERGRDVRVVDDFSTGRRGNLEGVLDRIELIEGSIADPDVCRRACDGVDVVFHQAALPSVARSVEDPVGTHAADATGTLNLLVASAAAGVGRFVYAASSSAYGNAPELPKREDMPPRPLSPYAAAKLAGEHYCRAFHAIHGIRTVCLRYFNVFGPGQDPTSQYSAVIPAFVEAALEERAPVIDGDGEQTRDFTHIANVVDANLKAASVDDEVAFGEVFNIGCGERISINRLWAVIRELTGAEVEARHGPPRAGDVRDSLASIEKAREVLGFEPLVGLEDGLKDTVAWLRTQ